MTCPRCSVPLARTMLRDMSLVYNALRCAQCAGIWIGPKQLRDISMTVDERMIEIHHVPSARGQQVPLRCPACPGGVVMEKVGSARDAKVVMDVCPTCEHVGLDGGEREAIERDGFFNVLRDVLHRRSRAARADG